MSKSKGVWLSQSVTRSPIELFWTAKNMWPPLGPPGGTACQARGALEGGVWATERWRSSWSAAAAGSRRGGTPARSPPRYFPQWSSTRSLNRSLSDFNAWGLWQHCSSGQCHWWSRSGDFSSHYIWYITKQLKYFVIVPIIISGWGTEFSLSSAGLS